MSSRAFVLIVVAMALGLGVAGISVVLLADDSEGDEPSTVVETVATGPAGQPGPIDIEKPNYPQDPGKPTLVGPFRLLPFGYFDSPDSTPRAQPTCEPRAEGVDPAAAILGSPLRSDKVEAPSDFTAAEPVATIICGTEVRELQWRLSTDKPGREVRITKFYFAEPFDVRLPPEDSWYTVESGEVDGAPALLLASKQGQSGPQSVYVAQDGVMTIAVGDAVTFDELLALVRSMGTE